MLLILLSNAIPLFVNWLTTAYNCPIITIYKSVLAMLISPTNSKVIAVVGVTLGGILFDKLFLPSTVTVVVIILYSKVSSTYILI
jgi:TctA family transporter